MPRCLQFIFQRRDRGKGLVAGGGAFRQFRLMQVAIIRMQSCGMDSGQCGHEMIQGLRRIAGSHSRSVLADVQVQQDIDLFP